MLRITVRLLKHALWHDRNGTAKILNIEKYKPSERKGHRTAGSAAKVIYETSITYDTPLYKKIILAVVCFTVAVLCGIGGACTCHEWCIRRSGRGIRELCFTGLDELAPDVKARLLSGLITRTKEVRGVWIASVSNINFPSKRDFRAHSSKPSLTTSSLTCVAANLNAIYFQVRPNSDALYKSSIFPTSEWLTGVQGSGLQDNFDPLEYLVAAAHEKGIAVHAWINPLRVTVGSASAPQHDVTKLASNNPARLHPEWTVAYADGKLYYNPGIPEVWKLVADGITEIVKNYDVDGVVFDDYFYPYPVAGAEFDDEKQFKEYGAGYAASGLAAGQYPQAGKPRTMPSKRRKCRIGIAPGSIWQNDDGKNGGATKDLRHISRFTQTLAWVKGGYVDYIAPQIYWRFHTRLRRLTLVRWWNAFMIQCRTSAADIPRRISHRRVFRAPKSRTGYMRAAGGISRQHNVRLCGDKGKYLLRDALTSIYSDEIICKPFIRRQLSDCHPPKTAARSITKPI